MFFVSAAAALPSASGGVTSSRYRVGSFFIITLQLLQLLVLPRCQAQLASVSNCGLPGGGPIGTAGLSVRWPTPNPELVAPVFIRYSYHQYSHPLSAEFTGHSITVTIPPDFIAGFSLVNTSNPNSTNGTIEQYRLRTLELRKPGMMPAGIGQVLPHVFELAMMHEETSGTGYWANVVIPFELSSNPEANGDALSALVENSQLPTAPGEVQALGMGSSWTLDLSPAFEATFSQYWTTLPGFCPGSQVTARQFMRNETMQTLYSTFASLMDALEHVVPNVPEDAPQPTWLVGACKLGSTCTPLQASNLSAQIQNLTQTQSQAVESLRQRKAEMDAALSALANSTNGSTHVSNASGLYNVSTNAAQHLLNAQAALGSVTQSLNEVQAQQNSTAGASFDANIPTANTSLTIPNTSSSSSVPLAHVGGSHILPSTGAADTSASNLSSGSTENVTTNSSMDAASNASALVTTYAHRFTGALAIRDGARLPGSSGGGGGSSGVADCRALGLSPAAIDTKTAINPETAAKYLKEPLRFTRAGLVSTQVTADGQDEELPQDHPYLRLHNNGGEHLRVTVPLGADLALEMPRSWPFGAILDSSGHERRISYIEIHVPGEHEIDGAAAVAEIQLVHLPTANSSFAERPAVAVALLLDEVPGGSNPWLEPLLAALPAINEERTAQGEASLVDLHPAMHRGLVRHYFRYDGTLTRVPCHQTEWYVLREHGAISSEEISALRRALPHAAGHGSQTSSMPATFTPSLVAEGVQRFVAQPPRKGPPLSLRARFQNSHRDQLATEESQRKLRF